MTAAADTARTTAAGGRVLAQSGPVRASGFATVGLTWDAGSDASGQRFLVRSRDAGVWSSWQELHADVEHAPDPGTAEAAGVRPGTGPAVVGEVDAVQVKAVATSSETTRTTAGRATAPRGLTLAVVDPGDDPQARTGTSRLGRPAYRAKRDKSGDLRRPGIYSRKQWGANESMRDGFSGYGKIRGGFVHHTVSANGYSRGDVPAMLRGIYAYHTGSNGWSDIGYNFLIDRFGRVWEGRWGGIRRPVIGAHTYGYNHESFAASAIGNYESAKPGKRMVRAYARLFAWKLGRAGVDAGDRRVRIAGDRFKAISGHRDADSTACPGRYLYDRLGRIRHRADRIQ